MLDLRSLYLQDFFLPLVEFGRPLSFLRHLSLDRPTHYRNRDHHTSFQFLSPLYLPKLESLNLHQIYLSSPGFLDSFLTCAPQIRSLFLAPLDYPLGSHHQPELSSAVNTLPPELLSACTSLQHLGLYNISRGNCVEFNPFLEHLSPSLRTLFLHPSDFLHLQETDAFSWEGLPPNLSTLKQIIIHPNEGFFPEEEEEIQCWARQVGVKCRFALKYASNWVSKELHHNFERWEGEVTAVEVWNDLRETGQLN